MAEWLPYVRVCEVWSSHLGLAKSYTVLQTFQKNSSQLNSKHKVGTRNSRNIYIGRK